MEACAHRRFALRRVHRKSKAPIVSTHTHTLKHSALLTRRIDCAEYFVSWYFMDVLQQTVSVFVGRSTKGQTMHTYTLPSMAKLVVFYTLIIKLHIAHIKHT